MRLQSLLYVGVHLPTLSGFSRRHFKQNLRDNKLDRTLKLKYAHHFRKHKLCIFSNLYSPKTIHINQEHRLNQEATPTKPIQDTSN